MDQATMEKVRNTVKKALKQGKSEDEVRDFMKGAGYLQEDIDKAFFELSKSGIEPKPEKLPEPVKSDNLPEPVPKQDSLATDLDSLSDLQSVDSGTESDAQPLFQPEPRIEPESSSMDDEPFTQLKSIKSEEPSPKKDSYKDLDSDETKASQRQMYVVIGLILSGIVAAYLAYLVLVAYSII